MSSDDALPVAVIVGGSVAVALVGWWFGAREARRGRPEVIASARWRFVGAGLVVVMAVGAAFTAPIVAVCWAVVALDLVLGRHENVPFSTYSMYSEPATRVWTVVFEDSAGNVIPMSTLGIAFHNAEKRFATELRAAPEQGAADMHEARRMAARHLAAEIERRRPPDGVYATSPVTIVFVEYLYRSGGIETVRTPLLETAPG